MIQEQVNTSLESKLTLLQDRAEMLRRVRQFFDERQILEVDTQILSNAACIDAHIDLMEVEISSNQRGYLHSSPEYEMKKLLSYGMGDIYQLSHVFRKEEVGKVHLSEFTLIEWYRIQFSLHSMIQETLELLFLFLGDQPLEILTYQEAFLRYGGLDPFQTSKEKILAHALQYDLQLFSDTKENLLNQLFGCVVEPNLGKDGFTVISEYPKEQAALAQVIQKKDKEVALRFEIYFQGLELANGYKELTDAQEQKKRLDLENQERIALGKTALPFDKEFLQALERGLPECCGVAVGFDRLMMLKHHQKNIFDVIPKIT